MDALKSLLTEFDPAALVPELDTVMGWLELALRVAVMAGPIVLLIMGLQFLLLPPKEANHIAGYRFFWGMGSVLSWKFTQRIAGIGWTALGLILTLVMLLITNGYPDMDIMDMAYNAMTCILWEIGTAAAVCLVINVIVIVCFDFKGNIRPFGKAKLQEKAKPKAKSKK
jgi:hypothetical protein